MFRLTILLCILKFVTPSILTREECMNLKAVNIENLSTLSKLIVPTLEGNKGDAGKIGVIGGSLEYTGAPYFAAISALKTGADLVYVITTESAAPVIKSYSPDLIVYPFLNNNDAHKINGLLPKMDVIIIGPGLGREEPIMNIIYDIMTVCRNLEKPLVVDADGLYAISQNVSIIKDYPSPGVILTPNSREAKKLEEAVARNDPAWHTFWGDYVTVLVKGKEDRYLSSQPAFGWTSSQGGSGRRAGGQGDILSGALATFYGWALKSDICEDKQQSLRFAHSVAALSAAKFVRKLNSECFAVHGRSMTASDMLNHIHTAFDKLFS